MSDSFKAPWTVACQAPLPMGFPRQEYWSGLPFPSPGDHLDPGIKPTSDLEGNSFITEPKGKHDFLCFMPITVLSDFLFQCQFLFPKDTCLPLRILSLTFYVPYLNQ